MMSSELIYFADPMCSWCWGFAPVIAAVRDLYADRLPVRLVLGGLAVGTTKPLDERGKLSIREHWRHVAELAGRPFDFRFFDRDGFVYDTEPPCRAVVAARRLARGSSLEFFTFLQRAFYAENRDITDRPTLLALAGDFGLDRDGFAAEFDAEDTRRETSMDFQATRDADVDGYPALVAGDRDSGYSFITYGYQPWNKIEGIIDSWLESRSRQKP